MGRNVLLVGIGGCVGSILRYLAAVLFAGQINSAFPLSTFLVNVAGCLVIGLLYGLSDRSGLLSEEWRLLLATGFCGGFTTFSAFSYENIKLMQDGDLFNFFLYTALSLAAGFGATYVGILLTKLF